MIRTANNMVARVRASYRYYPTGLGTLGPLAPRSLASTNVYLTAGYTYSGAQYVHQMRTRVEIDLNVRVRGNDTFVGFEDVDGPIAVGETVEVYETESGASGEGRITEIDGDRELIYLSVNWPSLTAEATSSTYEETTTPTTRLLFIGASTAATTTTSLQEPWFELVPRPCLADIGGGDAAMWITAPLYESSDWLLKGPAEPYVEMHQVNVSLANSPVVAA